MTTQDKDVLIIGAGLTGLTLAYLLKQTPLKVTIIEANTRIGGRILTKYNTNEAAIDLGATWIVPQQSNVLNLVKQLDIKLFKQSYGKTAIYHPDNSKQPQLVTLPNNDSVSYRIKDGTETIIKTLANTLPKHTFKTNTSVQSLQLKAETILVQTDKQNYNSRYVVSTLPPALFNQKISIQPELPDNLINVLANTHTWMHNSIRAGFTYKTPFWNNQNTSGTIYANSGPLQEFYDHSNATQSLFSLSGFMSGSLLHKTKNERQQMALQQLQSYYGNQALEFLSYEECIWQQQPFTTPSYDNFVMPQQNNGHPLFKSTYLNNKLFIAGAETNTRFSGKMEAAVTSAHEVFNLLKEEIK